MATEAITIRVDAAAARAYREASPEERRKLEALLSLRLLQATQPSASLRDLMRTISLRAQERGLTEQELREILDASGD